MKIKYVPTGNEYVALPCINEENAGIGGLSILNYNQKGMLEILGSTDCPFLVPVVYIDGEKRKLENLVWTRECYWIPTFTGTVDQYKIKGTVLSPIGERGFCVKIEISGSDQTARNIKYGFEGCWEKTLHTVNESKEIIVEKNFYKSGWNYGYVFDLRTPLPLFAFAPMFDEEVEQYCEKTNNVIHFSYYKQAKTSISFSFSSIIFMGVSFEEVAAATSSKEMFRRTFEDLYDSTVKYLESRCLTVNDTKLDKLMNTNLFFSRFFATGLTLDTEELTLMTSRSPRYYVSAAYWDRDSLLWSFPAILLCDKKLAKQMITYVFTKQIKNVGIHSRYIDGTVLEPGFELDELCAPIIALSKYYEQTKDLDFIKKQFIIDGVELILEKMAEHKHSSVDLYDTWLQPTDDTRVYPYITYDNVLCKVALEKIAKMYADTFSKERIDELVNKANAIKQAIYAYCVKNVDGKDVFIWSTDCNGHWDIYDEPPGSLLLLSHYGFVEASDEIYVNTVNIIKRKEYKYSFYGCPIEEIGCPHAPHPWVLSIANSLLCGKKEQAKKNLYQCEMDNYIACESVDEYTGESKTGDAFATCAGFLAYAIYSAFGDGDTI